VDDPYEAPEHAEVVIDTSHMTPAEAAQEILVVLGQRGYV
jgi:sulfate adenylyltransferase